MEVASITHKVEVDDYELKHSAKQATLNIFYLWYMRAVQIGWMAMAI
jgi:hypothetical protein